MTASHVYLVRHAKAEKESTSGGDSGRRLTAEGRRAFAELTRERRRDLTVTRILASPFARALETARLLAHVTGAPVEEDEELSSGRIGGKELLALARRSGPGVALVGHNPEVQEAIALAAGRDEPVRPGTIAAVEFRNGDAALAWIAAPARNG